jgi:hypothetical protein
VRDEMVGRLQKLGVEIIPYARLFGADESTVYFQHATSGEAMLMEEVDTLVLSQGHERAGRLADELQEIGVAVHVIGDALTPRTAEEAVLDGLKLATLDGFG